MVPMRIFPFALLLLFSGIGFVAFSKTTTMSTGFTEAIAAKINQTLRSFEDPVAIVTCIVLDTSLNSASPGRDFG